VIAWEWFLSDYAVIKYDTINQPCALQRRKKIMHSLKNLKPNGNYMYAIYML